MDSVAGSGNRVVGVLAERGQLVNLSLKRGLIVGGKRGSVADKVLNARGDGIRGYIKLRNEFCGLGRYCHVGLL